MDDIELKLSAVTRITTERAERYAKQLIGHWARHSDVTESEDGATTLRFPAADSWPPTAVRVEATRNLLTLTAWADAAEDLRENCEAIAEHLHRFADRRESLTIVWR